MSEYHTLIGADDVLRGGNQMIVAADHIERQVGRLEDALHRHEQFLDDWLQRYEDVLKASVARPMLAPGANTAAIARTLEDGVLLPGVSAPILGVSSCCHRAVRIVGNVTQHYVCEHCKKECDLA